MHVTCMANAWGYAQSAGNTFGVVPGAIGTGVKIAIMDTGADLTHPDLLGKVVYTATYVSTTGQVEKNPMHDNNGHGTNVAGIAAADTNNGYGFVGAGHDASLMIYRVFPDPPNPCNGAVSTGPTSCETSASTVDIAAAINDAVANGAKVISLSLGGGACPDDPTEAAAVANAIANNVVVVAAAGNETATTIDAPACDPGVIAVGASALNDTNPVAVSEKVASYSNYSTAAPTTWGVVAPGGDPDANDTNPNLPTDSLHWIENLYTSTSSDPSFSAAQVCTTDPFGGVGDCRALIAGTSQATPHVSGIAALMIGARPGMTPAKIASILCSTAININDPKQGCGRVEAYRAVARAVGDGSVP